MMPQSLTASSPWMKVGCLFMIPTRSRLTCSGWITKCHAPPKLCAHVLLTNACWSCSLTMLVWSTWNFWPEMKGSTLRFTSRFCAGCVNPSGGKDQLCGPLESGTCIRITRHAMCQQIFWITSSLLTWQSGCGPTPHTVPTSPHVKKNRSEVADLQIWMSSRTL